MSKPLPLRESLNSHPPSSSSPLADSPEILHASSVAVASHPGESFPSFQDQSQDQDSVPELPPISRNFRKLTLESPVAQSPPQNQIRRKPLSSTASPIATRYSSGEYLTIIKGLPMPEHRFSRSNSVDSPTVYDFPRPPVAPRVADPNPATKPQTLTTNKESFLDIGNSPVSDHFDRSASPAQEVDHLYHPEVGNPAGPQTGRPARLSQHSDQSAYDDLLAERDEDVDEADNEDEDPLSDNIFDGYNSDTSYASNPNPNTDKSNMHVARKATPPHLNLEQVTPQEPNAHDIKTPNTDKPLPKSPGSSKLGTFFGWGSPSTATSDKVLSPAPSPFNFSKAASVSDASPVSTTAPQPLLGAPKTPHGPPGSPYAEPYFATPQGGAPSPYLQIQEMEDELKAISAELASSIRREIDLEDLVDRLQAERENPTSTSNRRTSDYFSDSGYSSAKFSDYDQPREEIERIQRKAEQEKAQVRLELTNKLQEERSRRQQLDIQIKELSEKASQIDLANVNNVDNDRVRELEGTCETLRRKLAEERQVKDNFEDLLSALRGELENASNERDNLRDEIVPQLRSRVEGLEGQAAELERMSYESSKTQQELQNLKTENFNLKESLSRSMDSISEDAIPRSSRPNSIIGPPGLARSNSVASFRRPPSLLSRSVTVKSSESRDLSERLKDVEDQRDALHRALKNLLERQEYQSRENDKKIKALEMERDRLLASSPGKAGFQKEVSNLRAEINVLRRRAEEALEQKWQVEKGLAGIKMDLDRAEQEIASLRSLLNEKDILIPPSFVRSSMGGDQPDAPVTSERLTAAYQDLHKAYGEALQRIKNLEGGALVLDEKTQLAMEKLEYTLSSTTMERDFARQEASAYKEQLDALKAGEQQYLESEKALSDELQESARRVEELALQVRRQLSVNQELRQRIADTVARGDAQQKTNSERITAMQARLRFLEEKLDASQNASEDRITRHEEEMQALKDSHNNQLTRMHDSLRSPRVFPPKSPLSPLFTGAGARPPRISSTRSGPAMNISEEIQIDNLRARIAELENALTDADSEMEQVVSRMNAAQIEVLELQEEREATVNRTRKLERELEAEKLRAFQDRFKTLQSY
ncbi:hypothetical protein DL766_007984 [Monosporascus sp. MC13-8B]|uniref:DUF7603 domain-containing protein n=1 Tax=Monosporascus cannonballus TaxID=155416 RepID=A0ABY0H2F0_9PEZI|nr:hypothetical protein DL762_006436 [Monosporascus cannonballus]RYO86003.1 hypothetical protein DL763_006873 [Monosporascus cannonballus]RYP21299.1 hypothetical protein DL766_007984 [Monosporascus sp. MC13-8B]